jgi:hypothetical protein
MAQLSAQTPTRLAEEIIKPVFAGMTVGLFGTAITAQHVTASALATGEFVPLPDS